MPDQPFLRFMDVCQQGSLGHPHLLCKFAGIDPPGMIEITFVIGFEQDRFLLGRQNIKNSGYMGIIIVD
jgi:hypothetical protein